MFLQYSDFCCWLVDLLTTAVHFNFFFPFVFWDLITEYFLLSEIGLFQPDTTRNGRDTEQTWCPAIGSINHGAQAPSQQGVNTMVLPGEKELIGQVSWMVNDLQSLVCDLFYLVVLVKASTEQLFGTLSLWLMKPEQQSSFPSLWAMRFASCLSAAPCLHVTASLSLQSCSLPVLEHWRTAAWFASPLGSRCTAPGMRESWGPWVALRHSSELR